VALLSDAQGTQPAAPRSFSRVAAQVTPGLRSYIPAKADFDRLLRDDKLERWARRTPGGGVSQPPCSRDDFLDDERALWLVVDALAGQTHLCPRPHQRSLYLTARRLQGPARLARYGLLAMTAFEPAAWCAHEPRICGLPQFHTFGGPLLSARGSAALEVGCALLLLSHAAALARSVGVRAFCADRARVFGAVLPVAVAACALLRALSGGGVGRACYALGPLVRVTLFCAASEQVRRQLRMLGRLFPPFASVLLLLGVHVLCFAWLGTSLFPPGSGEGDAQFAGLGSALWSLVVLLSTCNFPDVALPTYASARISLLFFAAFATVGVWLLMSLLCAVVYRSYSEQHGVDAEVRRAAAALGLVDAFALLADAETEDGKAAISYGAAQRLLVLLLRAQGTVGWEREGSVRARADSALAALSAPGGAQGAQMVVDTESWLTLATALEGAVYELPAGPTFAQLWFPALTRTRAHGRLERLVARGWLDALVEALLLGNVLMLVLEELELLQGKHAVRGSDGMLWGLLELGCALAFACEVCVRVWVLGLRSYWHRPVHRVDVLATLAATAVAFATLLPGCDYSGAGTVRLILSARLVRVLRLLSRNSHFAFVAATCVEVLPAASSLVKSLFALCYTYAAVGVVLFGGLVCSADAPGCSASALAGSDYAQLGYWPVNFNSVGDGMVLLFHLLLVNNCEPNSGGGGGRCGERARAGALVRARNEPLPPLPQRGSRVCAPLPSRPTAGRASDDAGVCARLADGQRLGPPLFHFLLRAWCFGRAERVPGVCARALCRQARAGGDGGRRARAS
jgi:hypothetical protein